MVHALYLLLLAVSIGGTVISLLNAAKVLKSYGTSALPEAACYVGSSVLLFLSLWLPFHRHTLTSGGIDGDLVSAALALYFLPSALRWLCQRRKNRVKGGSA